MKIVIDIPEERYKDMQRIAEVQLDRNHFQTAEQIIANGVPVDTSGDCISRQAAIDEIEYEEEYGRIDTGKAVEVLKKLPSVIPEKPHGKWIPIEYDGYADGFPVWDKWECNQCGYEHNGEEKTLDEYCAGCGAEMEINNE